MRDDNTFHDNINAAADEFKQAVLNAVLDPPEGLGEHIGRAVEDIIFGPELDEHHRTAHRAVGARS